MYVLAHFREDRVEVLHETIRRIGIGALVTLGPDGLIASHLPMLLQAEPAPYGRLCGHMARNNPQWLSIAPDTETPAIFTGPEAYISPSWYPAKRRTGKVVPTWNNVAIHDYGVVRVFDDRACERTDGRYEIGRAEPWAVSDAPKNYVQKMLKQIVGLELTITRLEGKWKMSQNRDEEDRHGAAEGLRREAGRAGAAVADLITTLNRD